MTKSTQSPIAITEPLTYFNAKATPESNVTVYLGGLVGVNRRGSYWEALFLQGVPDHPLHMSTFIHARGAKPLRDEIFLEDPAIGIVNLDLGSSRPSATPRSAREYEDARDISFLGDFSDLYNHRQIKIEKGQHSLVGFWMEGGSGYNGRMCGAGEQIAQKYRFGNSGADHLLGQFLAIESRVNPGSRISIKIDNAIKKSIEINSGMDVRIIICNACGSGGPENTDDFGLFYVEKGGFVNEDLVTLTLTPRESNIVSHRIGCNAMMISELDPSVSSLLDVLDQPAPKTDDAE